MSNFKITRYHQKIGQGNVTFLSPQKDGKKARVADSVVMDLTGDVTLHEEIEIADGVRIFTHKHLWKGSRDLRRKMQKIEKKDLIIYKDVFIGVNSIILAIDYIGEGAIIGAGSVVTKNVPPYEIWAGNPAKKINER